MAKNNELIELRKLAEAVQCWAYNTVKQAQDIDICEVGYTNEDGVFYELITLDCENYDVSSQPLAKFITATNPGKVIGLLDALETQAKQIEELQADADRYRLLRLGLYRGDVNVGEAYITMHAVGSCPSEKEFDAAIDAARKGTL